MKSAACHLLPRSLLTLSLFFFLSFAIPASSADNHPAPADTAFELLHQGEYDKAIAILQEDFTLFPYDERIRKRLADAWMEVGSHRLEHKAYDEAAAGFARALELYPDRPDLMTFQGIALYGGKRYDQAAVLLDQALQSGGSNPLAWFYLGRVHYDSGDLPGALEAWDRALALDPANGAIRAMMEKARRESVVESGMTREHRSMFVVSYDEGKMSDLADKVLETLDTAYAQVGSDLDFYPSVPVPVILYTRKDYRNITSGPEWSGGMYDGKVRLPIGGARELSPPLRGVLLHEYTHVVVREMTKGNCPTWLNEGLAMVEEHRESSPMTLKAGKGEPLDISVLSGSFLSLGGRDAALAYRQSSIMADYLVSEYGWHKVREILVNLGTGMGIDRAVSSAFSDYGLDYPAIMQKLLDKIVTEQERSDS
jgi:tetratricopeptide (TPR) repeat protein